MKYLAILRDSFRESLDSKILYVTLVLSGLMILFITSIRIRPITMQEELEARASLGQLILSPQQQGVECRLEEFKQTNEAAEPWKGDYEFTLVLTVPMRPEEQQQLGMLRSLVDPALGHAFTLLVEGFFAHLNITQIQQQKGEANEYRIKVISKGTKITREQDWNHEPVLFFGALPAPWLITSPALMVLFIENNLVNAIAGWIIVLLGIIATASFVPNLLRKGSVDLILSKPVGRAKLLAFKYLGGLTFLFLNASLIIGVVWLNIGLQTGIWSWAFLLTVPLLTFFFAILYAVSTLAAVLTHSSVVCILVTCAAWFLLWLVGILYGWANPDPLLMDTAAAKIEQAQRGASVERTGPQLPRWASGTITTLYHILPRTRDLGRLTRRLLSQDLMSEEVRRIEGLNAPLRTGWAEALGVSMAWIVGLLGLSCWRFARRDY